MSLLGAGEIRVLAERLGVNPTKKLGQNFVHDANTVRRIVALADLPPESHVLEIGPGLGSLTLGLLAAGHSVTAVEIDARLAEELPITVAAKLPDAVDRLTVIAKDAMKVDWIVPSPAALVANLPYNISVPVFLHVLARMPDIQTAVVMVQAEVGERMAAASGSKIYGSPSVKIAWYGSARVAGKVSREVFWPVPNVDSVLVKFQRSERDLSFLPEGAEPDLFRQGVFSIVDAAFQQRRKMLRQALSSLYGTSTLAIEAMDAAGVAPTARGEELGVGDFIAIAAASAHPTTDRSTDS